MIDFYEPVCVLWESLHFIMFSEGADYNKTRIRREGFFVRFKEDPFLYKAGKVWGSGYEMDVFWIPKRYPYYIIETFEHMNGKKQTKVIQKGLEKVKVRNIDIHKPPVIPNIYPYLKNNEWYYLGSPKIEGRTNIILRTGFIPVIDGEIPKNIKVYSHLTLEEYKKIYESKEYSFYISNNEEKDIIKLEENKIIYKTDKFKVLNIPPAKIIYSGVIKVEYR